MRVTVVALCLILLLAATCEASRHFLKHHDRAPAKAARIAKTVNTQMKKHGRLPKSIRALTAAPVSKHRSFGVLQNDQIPSCSAAGFNEAIVTTSTACQDGNFPDMDKLDPKNATTVVDTFCAGACATALAQIADNAEYMKCLEGSSIAQFPLMGKLMCTKVNGESCFPKLASLDGGNFIDVDETCFMHRNQTACGTGCKWDSTTKRCNPDAAEALNGFCGGADTITQCLDALGAIVPAKDKEEATSAIAAVRGMMCTKVQDKFCAAEMPFLFGMLGDDDKDDDRHDGEGDHNNGGNQRQPSSAVSRIHGCFQDPNTQQTSCGIAITCALDVHNDWKTTNCTQDQLNRTLATATGNSSVDMCITFTDGYRECRMFGHCTGQNEKTCQFRDPFGGDNNNGGDDQNHPVSGHVKVNGCFKDGEGSQCGLKMVCELDVQSDDFKFKNCTEDQLNKTLATATGDGNTTLSLCLKFENGHYECRMFGYCTGTTDRTCHMRDPWGHDGGHHTDDHDNHTKWESNADRAYARISQCTASTDGTSKPQCEHKLTCAMNSSMMPTNCSESAFNDTLKTNTALVHLELCEEWNDGRFNCRLMMICNGTTEQSCRPAPMDKMTTTTSTSSRRQTSTDSLKPVSPHDLRGKTCNDTTCSRCEESKLPTDAKIEGNCMAQNGASVAYFYDGTKHVLVIRSFANSDCTGTPINTATFPVDKCQIMGTNSMTISLRQTSGGGDYDDGKYDDDKDHSDDNDDDMWQYFCNDQFAFNCLKAMAPAIQQLGKGDLEKEFYQCVNMCKNETSCVDRYCVPKLQKETRDSDINFHLDHMCARNEKNEWCQTVLQRHDKLECTREGKCNAECDESMKEAFDDLGCCIGMFANAEKLPSVTPPPYKEQNTAGGDQQQQQQEQEKENGVEQGVRSTTVCASITNATVDAALAKRCTAQDQLTSVDPCYSADFREKMAKLDEACSAETLGALTQTHSTDAAAETAFTTFCTSQCRTLAEDLLKTHVRCMDRDTQEMISSGLVLCEKDSNGKYCGVQARKFDIVDSCDDKSKTQCDSANSCTWVGTADKGDCEIQPSTDVLNSLCSNCLTKITNAMGSDKSEAREAAAMQQFMCVKHDDKFCFPEVAADIRSIDNTGFKNATLTAACSNRLKEKCMIKMMSGAASIETRDVTRKYRTCVKDVQQKSGNDKQYKFNECVDKFEGDRREIITTQTQVQFMCRKNGDLFCMSILESDGPENNKCLASAIGENGQGTCTSECQTTLQGMLNKWGCCAGTLHQLFMKPPMTKNDLPSIPEGVKLMIDGKEVDLTKTDAATGTPAPTPSTADGTQYFPNIGRHYNNGLFFLGVCSEINKTLADKLHIGCARPKGTVKITKEKPLPVSFKKIKANPALEKKLVDSLTQDTATALGLPKEDIVDPRLEEDKTSTVVTHRRRFGTLAESSGSKFVFDIQSTSDENTQAEAAKFDELVSSGEFTLPTATEVVADCGCKDETVKSLAVAAPPPAAPVAVPTIPPSNVTSGAQSMSVFAVVLALLVAALF